MTPKLVALEIVLVAFLGLTLWALGAHGYLGFFETLLATPAGIQTFGDIVIALSLALAWMRGDARERALPFAPYLVLTLVLGSIGLLAYLVHRETRARSLRAVTA